MRIFSKSIWFIFIVERQRSHDTKSFLFPFIASLSKPRDNRAAFFVRSFTAIPVYKIKAPEKIRGFGQYIFYLSWWSRKGSNLRPHACEACALTNWATRPFYTTIRIERCQYITFFLSCQSFYGKNFLLFQKFPYKCPSVLFSKENFLWKHTKSLVLFNKMYYIIRE